MIRIEMPPEVFDNLRKLVIAGAKSPQTDETAIMAAAQILQMMDMQAEQQASPTKALNGSSHSPAGQPT